MIARFFYNIVTFCVIIYLAVILVFPGMSKIAAAGTSDSATVLVSQDGQEVTLGDVDAFAERIPIEDRPGFFAKSERVEELLLKLLLDKHLASKVAGTELDPRSELDAPRSVSDNEALARVEIRRFRSTLQLPDFSSLAREEFIANKEKYRTSELLRLRKIYISTSRRTAEEARLLAAGIVLRARAPGNDFGELVAELSDDPNKHVDLGFIKNAAKGEVDADLAEAARKMEVGDISDPIEGSGGFYVIELLRKEAPRDRPFEELQSEIELRLANAYVEKQVQIYIQAIKALPLEANLEAISSLQHRYGSLASHRLSE